MKYVILMLMLVVSGSYAKTEAQVATELESLRAQGAREGWTFEVGDSPALRHSLSFRTGLRLPENWESLAPFHSPRMDREVLPSSWDWRDHNGVTDIKNQGSCGSCWAFGTVAAFESAIKIATGNSVNVSEQQLVSCRPSYGTCGGGYYAFGFYQGHGAGYTSDFPYTASNSRCKTVSEHEKAGTWAYVGAKGRQPTTDEIKAAIYKYGVVSVTVSASGAFGSYRSGVYNACNSGGTNHLVALVGWNDDDQAWILKNSWGKSWGDQGYMRIKYTGKSGHKCNSVGESAAFVTFTPQEIAAMSH